MGWGSDLFGGIVGALLKGESAIKNGVDSVLNNRATGNFSNPDKNFHYDPLEDFDNSQSNNANTSKKESLNTKPNRSNNINNLFDEKPEDYSRFTANSKPVNRKSANSKEESFASESKKTYSENYYNNEKSTAQQTKSESEYKSENYSNSNEYTYDNYYKTDSKETNNTSGTKKKEVKKDKSSFASAYFKRKHAVRSSDNVYIYPTLSKKGFSVVENDLASFTFGEPHFSTYDHGVRGIAFPFSLAVNKAQNRNIVVSAKFCDATGKWIKSLVPSVADKYGDVILNEAVFCEEPNYFTESYLFIPYGVLALTQTQKIYMNIDVFVDGDGPQHLLRYVYGFSYYVYENDPREPETVSTLSSDKTGFKELINLIAHVIKADGICAPEEIRTVIDFFKDFNGVDKEQLRETLKEKLAFPSNIIYDCSVLRSSFNTQTRLSFVALFFKIAKSDNKIPPEELEMIETISTLLGITESCFESLKNQFMPASVGLWGIFGLTPSATKEELKRAYRQKCKECHPDRFANAPEHLYKQAEEHFKEMQDAYQTLLRKLSV